MSLKDAWRDAFPAESARAVVAYVMEMWKQTAAKQVPAFSWEQKEPVLTQKFKTVLRDDARAAGLSGNWGAEDVSQKLDPKTLEKIKAFKTDITYYSDREYPKILALTFEWKKLLDQPKSRSGYWGPAGMGRFLEEGGYSKDAPFGLMVGILPSPAAKTHVDALRKAMNDDGAVSFLNYVPADNGQHVRRPSTEMPGLSDFDTQHVRNSGGFQTFTFCHLFVYFP